MKHGILHQVLLASICVSMAWVVYIGIILINCQRLPYDVSGTKFEVTSINNTLYSGYLMSGLETTALARRVPMPEDDMYERVKIGCWVDWTRTTEVPWWAHFHIRGYAVIAGRLEQSEVPTFGHFGQYKRQLIVTKTVIPPLPVTVGYWLISVIISNAIWLVFRSWKNRVPD